VSLVVGHPRISSLLVLGGSLTDDAGSAETAENPVLALLPLYPVLLPGGGPEEGRGDVREAAGDETPHTAVLLHGLPVVAGDTGAAAEDLAADARVPVALAQPVLPLVLNDVGHVGSQNCLVPSPP